jgi:adenylate cyclase
MADKDESPPQPAQPPEPSGADAPDADAPDAGAPDARARLVGALVERGLYDPAAADAEDTLALLLHYAGRGISLEEMALALADDRLANLTADLAFFDFGPETSLAEVAERSGVGIERVQRIRLATGLPADPGSAVPAWVAEDVVGFTLASALFGESPTLAFSRVIGAVASRLAEAAVSLFLTEVDAGLVRRHASALEHALANEQAGELLGVVSGITEHLFREHLALAIKRQRAIVEPGAGAVVRTAVGFVDLVGSTEWAGSLDPRAQADALAVFEELAWDLTGRHGGRVVKLIGDEVMLVATDPADACEIGIELCRAVAGVPLLPDARAAVGYGEVAFRDGDFYGPLVHVTARAVKAAEPSTVVADAAVRARCEADSSPLEFWPLGPTDLRGVPEPVELYVVTGGTTR